MGVLIFISGFASHHVYNPIKKVGVLAGKRFLKEQGCSTGLVDTC